MSQQCEKRLYDEGRIFPQIQCEGAPGHGGKHWARRGDARYTWDDANSVEETIAVPAGVSSEGPPSEPTEWPQHTWLLDQAALDARVAGRSKAFIAELRALSARLSLLEAENAELRAAMTTLDRIVLRTGMVQIDDEAGEIVVCSAIIPGTHEGVDCYSGRGPTLREALAAARVSSEKPTP
jgi:hypothetical protein